MVAHRVRLQQMRMHHELASNNEMPVCMCLDNPGKEYLARVPSRSSRPLRLRLVPGQYQVEWFDPTQGLFLSPGIIEVEGRSVFRQPSAGSVLHLQAV